MINNRERERERACSISERRQDALKFLLPLRLPKGGQRWDNTSEIGGVING